MIHGAVWVTIGMGVSKAVAAFSIIVVARILGKEDFGAYGVLRSTINTFAAFAAFGLGVSGNTLIAKYRDEDPGRTGKIISLSNHIAIAGGVLVSAAVLIFAPLIAEKMLKSPRLLPELYLAAGVLLFQSIHGNQLGILAGLEKFRAMVTISAAIEIFGVVLSLAGACFFGLRGVMAALLATTMLIYIGSEIFIRKFCREMDIKLCSPLAALEQVRTVMSLSVPVMLSAFFLWGGKWITDSIVFRQEGGKAQMGIYTAVLTIQAFLMMFSMSLNGPLLSIISSVRDEEQKRRVDKINLVLPWVLAAIPTLPFIVFPQIYALLFGAKYRGSDFNDAISITIFYALMFIMRQGSERVLLEKRLMWYSVGSNLLWGALQILLIFHFAKFGATGVAAANTIAFGVSCFLFMGIYHFRGLLVRDSVFSKQAWGLWGILLSLLIARAFTNDVILLSAALLSGYFLLFLLLLNWKNKFFRRDGANG